ncbi:hypothetical protein Aph02nite_47170 [Actinoplanes philippinensis]|nr:hypothetical protein Aph02nite_47170 [Actinoplanes philippinensis]
MNNLAPQGRYARPPARLTWGREGECEMYVTRTANAAQMDRTRVIRMRWRAAATIGFGDG